MDQPTAQRASDRYIAVDMLADHVAQAVEAAVVDRQPFCHVKLNGVFPERTYQAMLAAMPEATDYRPMHGRSRSVLADGKHARVKIDLFPEYIRHLPGDKLGVWSAVGAALCSDRVREAFRYKLAPDLETRFGKDYASVGMYPIPILTRDIPGYLIPPHTDTRWKAITVQLYLPRDDANANIGTIFHERLVDGSMPKRAQMKFVPNSGYAFAAGSDTWHSVDPVHDRVKTRDSILLTYFVDQGALKVLRNRARRFGNFVLNEIRNRT